MERENGNGNKILLTVIGAATLLVAMVGATFAYFSATSTTQERTVTTGNSSLEISASEDDISNIKPTTFISNTEADSNPDIVKITLKVKGSSTSNGTYDITMNEPDIEIKSLSGEGHEKESGDVSDIKYAVYKDGSVKLNATSFNGTEKATKIIENVSYSAGNITEDNNTYVVYVWVENDNNPQDNLQDISFKLTFTADARASL